MTTTSASWSSSHESAARVAARVLRAAHGRSHTGRAPRPDRDRLNVCMVDIGGSTPAQIVCGAPNVAAGQTVGVARPGAVMPDGTKLKKAKLRGVESQGMILSERELQLSDEHTGIMVLPDEITPGTPLDKVVPISTDVLV